MYRGSLFEHGQISSSSRKLLFLKDLVAERRMQCPLRLGSALTNLLTILRKELVRKVDHSNSCSLFSTPDLAALMYVSVRKCCCVRRRC